MKKWNCVVPGFVAFLLSVAILPAASFAAFVSGSTGADGDLILNSTPTSVVLQIPESGVFNYGVVNIPTGVTVTFTKNSQNTPVTILATGDVMINGAISVNGSNGANYRPAGAGGPGGFDGGIGGWYSSNGYRGLGPGGGDGSSSSGQSYGGVFTYGNDGQLPMMGGSGGGGGGGVSSYTGGSGGGGGGAILIAASGTITVNGPITAIGGKGYDVPWINGCCYPSPGGSGGSGGGIRLIATNIAGNGTISAVGGTGGTGNPTGVNGGDGRIRLEAWNFTRATTTSPLNTVKWNPTIIGPAAMPTLAISSIGGVSSPAVPKGNSSSPDVILPAGMSNPVAVVISSTNIPAGTAVTIKSLSSIGTTVQTVTATLTGMNDPLTATANINMVISYPTILTVTATFTAMASNGTPLYAEGERVDKIRVDSAMNGEQTVTYIMVSGREIRVKNS
jgi:hypothetical protein